MCFDLVLERYQTFLFQMLRNRPFLFFYFFYTSSLPLARNFGSRYLGKAQKPQEQQYFFLSVCGILY